MHLSLYERQLQTDQRDKTDQPPEQRIGLTNGRRNGYIFKKKVFPGAQIQHPALRRMFETIRELVQLAYVPEASERQQ